ncbi:MAG TPA: hypothetical protein PK295_04930, partial [Candidatus Magasanikbacteria bacterium]|nr:hypothetical protein [Candidatus Magasanikbacteria bacterium]
MLKRWVIIIVTCILLAGSLGASGYFYMKWKSATVVPTPEDTAEEVREVTSVVGAYMELPQGEEPTIATVIDKEKLKNQSFFAGAENGDKVLIYSNAKK